ncbi:PEP/pyruvate-binding domain-containing protein [Corynebacterium kroppenstedtii]|uniref:PEP/pyruvate-binding domain-containing protein n=1 Tax=Corynebacterium sp. PCR 32 TaxID=3351342 RepID=UPI0030A4DB81
MTIYWTPVRDIGDDMRNRAGGKACNLGEMVRAGIMVPPAVCVTTDAFQKLCQDSGITSIEELSPRDAREMSLHSPLPGVVRDAIVEAYRSLGEGRVAVRSSAIGEDSSEASFAGQQETFLHISGVDTVVGAVRRCWASLWSQRAIHYRCERGLSESDTVPDIAVVIQRMISPEVSGVLFTSDPVSIDTSTLVINASYGLGEAVVSSEVSPDQYRVRKADGHVIDRVMGDKDIMIVPAQDTAQGTATRPVDDDMRDQWSLDETTIQSLVSLGHVVEHHYGAPQDIEWGIANGTAYLLQTRPITTFPPRDCAHRTPKNRVEHTLRDDLIEHYPSPYPADIYCIRAIQSSIQSLMGDLGLSAPSAEDTIQMDVRGIAGVAPRVPRPTFSMLWKAPTMIRQVWATQPQDPYSAFAEHIDWIEHKEHELGIQSSRQIDASSVGLSHPDAQKLVVAAIEQASALTDLRFRLYLAPLIPCRKRLEKKVRVLNQRSHECWTPEDLLGNLEYKTALIDRDLASLAHRYAMIKRDHAFDSAVQARQNDSELRALYASFLDKHGARTSKMYVPFGSLSWSEDFRTLDAVVDACAANEEADSCPPQVDRILAAAEDELSAAGYRRFMRDTDLYRRFHVGREESVYLIERCLRIARLAFYSCATRLCDAHVIDARDEAKFLTLPEVFEFLAGSQSHESCQELRSIVATRRQWRNTAEVLWWKTSRQPSRPQDGRGLTGVAGSPGTVTGVARIIDGPADFEKLNKGDVLVCRYTDPTWTPLFSLASAVVTDRGGALSHAAIVARERGIPAVLGVGQATSALTSGTRVRVDGSAGSLTVLEPTL